MGQVLAIANQKGGVGKTTTAINLAASLAVAEQRVLLIDIDPQGNASSGLNAKPSHDGVSLYEVLLNQRQLGEVIVKTELGGLGVAPATSALVGAEIELVNQPKREGVLKKILKPVVGEYDFILVDCPPSLGLLTLNALTAADAVLIPVQCEYYAMEGVGQLLETVRRVQETYNPDLRIEGIVLTLFDARNRLAHQVAQEIRKFFPKQVFESVIPRNVTLAEAPSYGKPILLYSVGSTGAQAYLRLAEEVIRHAKEGIRQGIERAV